MDVLVIGIGQSFRGDDAFGLEAVRLWKEKYPETARQIRIETTEAPSVGLLDTINGANSVIFVDAIHADSRPGYLMRLRLKDLSSITQNVDTSHGWNVGKIIKLGEIINPAMKLIQVVFIGMIGADFGIKAGLSPLVESSMCSAIEMIESEVKRHLKAPPEGEMDIN